MDDRSKTVRKRDYRQIVAIAVLSAMLILVVAHMAGGSAAPPVAMATATPPAIPIGPPIPAPSSPLPALDPTKPAGVWQVVDPHASIQLQIRDWRAGAATAVLYVSAGRNSSMAIYKGRAVQRARTASALAMVVEYATTFSVTIDSSTRLPSTYAWCRRLAGTVMPNTDDLDIAPVCMDGAGRGIIDHVGSPGEGTIPAVLLDSGAHAILLYSTSG